MQIVIYALGTLGDIGPMSALAAELVRRGHSVSFLSNDYFQELIETSGCEFVSIGGESQYRKGNTDEAWQADNFEDNFEHYHAPAFKPSFNYVLTHTGADTVALILGNNSGAEAACERRGIPYIKIILSPNVVFSAISPPAPLRWAIPSSAPRWLMRLLMNRHRKVKFKRFCQAKFTEGYRKQRAELGCPLLYRKHDRSLLQVGLFPCWYAMAPSDWPSNFHLCHFPMINIVKQNARHQFDKLCEQLGQPIIFTAGSGRSSAEQLFREGRKVCEQIKCAWHFCGRGEERSAIGWGKFLCTY